MGSLSGHLVPGTFFLIFALWHAVDTFHRYFRQSMMCSKLTQNEFYKFYFRSILYGKRCGAFRNRASARSEVRCCCCSFNPFPADPAFKLVATAVGIVGEAVTGYDPEVRRFPT